MLTPAKNNTPANTVVPRRDPCVKVGNLTPNTDAEQREEMRAIVELLASQWGFTLPYKIWCPSMQPNKDLCNLLYMFFKDFDDASYCSDLLNSDEFGFIGNARVTASAHAGNKEVRVGHQVEFYAVKQERKEFFIASPRPQHSVWNQPLAGKTPVSAPVLDKPPTTGTQSKLSNASLKNVNDILKELVKEMSEELVKEMTEGAVIEVKMEVLAAAKCFNYTTTTSLGVQVDMSGAIAVGKTAAPVDQAVSAVDKTVPTVDQPAAPVDKAVPPVDQPAAPVDQPAAPVEKAVPTADQAVPTADQAVPTVDQPAAPADQAVPPVDQPAAPVAKPLFTLAKIYDGVYGEGMYEKNMKKGVLALLSQVEEDLLGYVQKGVKGGMKARVEKLTLTEFM